MTINEVAAQLVSLSKGMINGEKFTVQRLANQISRFMSGGRAESLKIPNHLVMTIVLPDGEWYFTIDKFPTIGEYNYTIPRTREEEATIINKLFDRAA